MGVPCEQVAATGTSSWTVTEWNSTIHAGLLAGK